jgi:hypothetical protein
MVPFKEQPPEGEVEEHLKMYDITDEQKTMNEEMEDEEGEQNSLQGEGNGEEKPEQGNGNGKQLVEHGGGTGEQHTAQGDGKAEQHSDHGEGKGEQHTEQGNGKGEQIIDQSNGKRKQDTKQGVGKVERARGSGIDAVELEARQTLGANQSHVTPGIHLLAHENAVVLLFGSKARVYEQATATSLSHIPGCDNCVSTALHSLAGAIEDHSGHENGKMTVWAILAKIYNRLDIISKWNLLSLRANGAVKALRYYSAASARDRDLYTKRHRGMDPPYCLL